MPLFGKTHLQMILEGNYTTNERNRYAEMYAANFRAESERIKAENEKLKEEIKELRNLINNRK